MDRDVFEQIGRQLLGGEEAGTWHRAMARELGPHHPSGAREYIDDRLVRRWLARERDIPDWVGPALRTILQAEISGLRNRLRGLELALQAEATDTVTARTTPRITVPEDDFPEPREPAGD